MSQGFTGSFLQNSVSVTDDTTTNTNYYPLFATGTGGFVPLKVSSTKLTYHPSTGNLTATTFTGALVGNADTASVAPAGTLTGATLNATVATSSLTAVGTIATGVWAGTTVAVIYGGTGATTLTAHGVVLGQGTSAVAVTSAGTTGQVLVSGGASADPSFQTKLPEKFTSSDQTITAAGALTLAHGLSAAPDAVGLSLVCQTNEMGYIAGDVLNYGYMGRPNGSRGASIVPDATNLNIRYGSGATTFEAINKTTGVTGNLTNANWKARFFAVLFH